MDYSRCIIKPCVESEIGKLNCVLINAPGPEIEHMTPENAHKFLFSDMLNQREAYNDYIFYKGKAEGIVECIKLMGLVEEFITVIK